MWRCNVKRFPLLYRIWIITSGAVFAVAMGLQLFFSWTKYGVLYNETLLWTCLGSFIVLIVGLTVWLCRHVYKRKASMASTVAGCVLLSLLGVIVHFAIIFFSVMAGHTATDAGSISGNKHYMHTSPEETNQFVIMFTGMDEEAIYAYPMLNRWIYKEVNNGFIWEAHVHEDEYTVEWPSEQLAIVTVQRENTETVVGENPDSRIIVDFGEVRK